MSTGESKLIDQIGFNLLVVSFAVTTLELLEFVFLFLHMKGPPIIKVDSKLLKSSFQIENFLNENCIEVERN